MAGSQHFDNAACFHVGADDLGLALDEILEDRDRFGVAVALGIFMGTRMGTTIMPYLANSGKNAVVVPPMIVQIDWTGFGITFGLLGVVFLIVIGLILASVYRMSIHTIMRMGEG